MMTLLDIVEKWFSGDWGKESPCEDAQNQICCIRGADIVPIANVDFKDIPIRFVSDRSLANRSLREGDIVIEKSGGSPTQSTGRSAFISKELMEARGPILCSNFCCAFRVRSGWNPKYIYYYLQYFYGLGTFFNFEGKTSGLKNLDVENAFTAIVAPSASKDVQDKVEGILSSIDHRIALNRKRIATLEAMAKEIYDYWFVQFDFPDAHGRPYKSSGGAMVYNPDLKREIPKGWEVVKLSRMADFLFGYPFDSSRFNSNGEGRRIVRIRNVKDGYSNDFTTEDAPSEYIIRNGDLLIGMDGYFDMNIWVGGDAYLVQRSCRVKARDGIYQGYVRRFIAPPIKQLEKTLLGATVAHLGKTHLDDIDIIVPPKDMRAFQMLNDLDASIVQQGLEVAKLSALRDFLLPVLMNGQAKVG